MFFSKDVASNKTDAHKEDEVATVFVGVNVLKNLRLQTRQEEEARQTGGHVKHG